MTERGSKLLGVLLVSAGLSMPYVATPTMAQDQRARPSPATAPAADRRGSGRAVANRMTSLPAFVDALKRGDSRAAKRIFVANGGAADQVILVPTPGWNPTTGFSVSEPFPSDNLDNDDPCVSWSLVPWGWNITTQSFSGWAWICVRQANAAGQTTWSHN